MTVRFTRTLLLVLAGASASTILFSGTANADRRSGAPIIYGEQTSSRSEQTFQARSRVPAQVPVATPSATRQADPKSRRLEFRYPDQPDVFYGAGGPRAAQAGDAPLAFSSAQAAIDVQEARQYAALPPANFPQASLPQPKVQTDPAITAGGFDARAAAARVAGQSMQVQPKSIRITAKTPSAASPVGKPLTLSRVRANREAPVSEETGRAGMYTDGFDGRPTANGEIFDNSAMTAAHPSLPLPSLVQVINQQNGREIVVRVNDRGPFAGDRIMDLSARAASMLGFGAGQTVQVEVRYLGPAPVMQAPQLAASQAVQEEEMTPFTPAPIQLAAYGEPSLGVADPINVMVPGPVATGNVYIQAGSFADIGNAQRLNAALGRRLPVEIREARVHNADYFRVMVGPFDTRAQAEVYRAHLSQAGIADGFVVVR